MKKSGPIAILLLLSAVFASAEESARPPRLGELARLVAHGYFGQYVAPEASAAECAAFLNSRGICFSIFDLMDPERRVTREDCARVAGQSVLLFSGEAEFEDGCIKKPAGAETWVDYCLLNDIDLQTIWGGLAQADPVRE